MAAVYDFKLCLAILVGFRDLLRSDGLYEDGFIGLMDSRFEKEHMPVYHLADDNGQVLNVQREDAEIFKDDLTGQPLPLDLVKDGGYRLPRSTQACARRKFGATDADIRGGHLSCILQCSHRWRESHVRHVAEGGP